MRQKGWSFGKCQVFNQGKLDNSILSVFLVLIEWALNASVHWALIICLGSFLHHLGLLAYRLDKPSCYFYSLDAINSFPFPWLAKDCDKIFHAVLPLWFLKLLFLSSDFIVFIGESELIMMLWLFVCGCAQGCVYTLIFLLNFALTSVTAWLLIRGQLSNWLYWNICFHSHEFVDETTLRSGFVPVAFLCFDLHFGHLAIPFPDAQWQ